MRIREKALNYWKKSWKMVHSIILYTIHFIRPYKKDKKYDDCIRVCEKAIDVLGFFSKDRKSRWNINLEKVTAQKEKHQKKMSE